MIRKPVQLSEDLHEKLSKDRRRFNIPKLENVVRFHRDRSLSHYFIYRKLSVGRRKELAGKHFCTEYLTWRSMIDRCINTVSPTYKNYGGRGIKVCEEWLVSFPRFIAYLKKNKMYPKPDGLSLDRINNDGNYEPGNIRWATPKQQANNTRRSKKYGKLIEEQSK
jgi:hypothetical protein